MSVSTDDFKRAIGSLAGGVVIVTTSTEDGAASGMTATAVCSVSLEPPLVMACMSHAAATYRAVQASGVFALNVLPGDAERLARHFASSGHDKFAGLETAVGVTGAPILVGALAHCDCEVERAVAAGDHTIFIGRVVQVACSEADLPPLLYFRGGYGSIAPLKRASSGAEGRSTTPEIDDAPVEDARAAGAEVAGAEVDGAEVDGDVRTRPGPDAWPNIP